MQSDHLHDGGRSPLPPNLQAISTSQNVLPDPATTQSPLSPTDFRKRSIVAASLHQPENNVMTSPKDKKESIVIAEELPSAYPGANLSFYKRFFCTPKDADPDRAYDPDNRSFSFRSPGFLLSTAMLTLLLLPAIIAPVVARHHGRGGHHPGFDRNVSQPRGPVGSTDSAANLTPESIVSLGLYASFADPYIIQHDGTWYAYATPNAVGIWGPDRPTYLYDRDFVQMATSTDFQNWTLGTHAEQPLPSVGAWAQQGNRKIAPQLPNANVWAPAVFQRPKDDRWVMYYSAQSANYAWTHCVGAAVGDSPSGPFTPADQAFACPYKIGGAIDPSPIIDTDNSIYITYKIDGNARGRGGQCGNTKKPIKRTPIMLQKTLDDGVTPDGQPVMILDRSTEDHDGPLVEAPSLVRSDEGIYFLFFSSGCTRNDNYNIKYAWSRNITGPYTRAVSPLVHTKDYNLLAPGSATVIKGADNVWRMAFHARVYTPFGAGLRMMFTTALHLDGTSVSLYAADQGSYNSTASIAAAAGDVQFPSDGTAAPLGNANSGNHGGADSINGGGKVPDADGQNDSPDASAGSTSDIDGDGDASDPTTSSISSSTATATSTLATVASTTTSQTLASPSDEAGKVHDPTNRRPRTGKGKTHPWSRNINGRD